MSKLIDKLKRLSQNSIQPIGFRHTQVKIEQPKMLIIARIAQNDIESFSENLAGADAVFISLPEVPSADMLQKITGILPDVPWGYYMEKTAKERIKQLAGVGCDFIIFPEAASLVLIEGEPGGILQVDLSLNDGLLRTLEDLEIDALLVSDKEKVSPLTWHQLMLVRRFTYLSKPILMSVPHGVTPDDLKVLWDVGVDGVILEVTKSGQKIKDLHQAIDKLTASSVRRKKRLAAVLPGVSLISKIEETEEEEEEEEGE